MVIAFDRKNKVEDTILFEEGARYLVQKRRNLQAIREFEVDRSEDDEAAYDKAEQVFDNWRK